MIQHWFWAVDQSIQLGDGGTGFTGEMNAILQIFQSILVHVAIYILFAESA